jgi:glycosyltransferase involved in cell wall biosynthesis
MISLIIPTFNEEKIIESTLCTIASTLTLPHEIIVSDGGSSDRTVDLATKFASTIVVFSGSGRQTIAQGRNDGAKTARGDFLIFLDADCVIPEPDRFFTKALAQFHKNPSLVALTANLRVFPPEETLGDRLVHGVANLALRLKNNLFNRGESFGEFQMIRREAFTRLGGFRADLVTIEDADMFRRLSKIGKTMIDPQLTVLHTGRRAHQVGWPRLIVMWLINSFFVSVYDRSFTREWKAIR